MVLTGPFRMHAVADALRVELAAMGYIVLRTL